MAINDLVQLNIQVPRDYRRALRALAIDANMSLQDFIIDTMRKNTDLDARVSLLTTFVASKQQSNDREQSTNAPIIVGRSKVEAVQS